MSHTHRHRGSPLPLRISTRCACPDRCVPEAHGGMVVRERCACGLERRTNVNGAHTNHRR